MFNVIEYEHRSNDIFKTWTIQEVETGKAARVLVASNDGLLIQVGKPYGGKPSFFPETGEELRKAVYSVFEVSPAEKLINGDVIATFDTLDEAISHVYDLSVATANDCLKIAIAKIDKDIEKAKNKLAALQTRRKENFHLINRFTGAI